MEVKVSEKVFSTDNFNIIKTNYENIDFYGLEFKNDSVIVLPYTTDSTGILDKIGVIKEYNPYRRNDFSVTLVTGTENDDDENILDTAKRELFEETNYKIDDDSLWMYLGKITLTKLVSSEHSCYAVNLSDSIQTSGQVTGKDKIEKLSQFNLIPISQVLKSSDGIVLSSIMKFFILTNNKYFKKI